MMSLATVLNDSRNAPSSFSDDVDESSSPRFFDNPDVQTPSAEPHGPFPRTKPIRPVGIMSPNEANARDQTNPMGISGRWVEKAGNTFHQAVSPNEVNTSSDVLSSETVVSPNEAKLGRRQKKKSQPQMKRINADHSKLFLRTLISFILSIFPICGSTSSLLFGFNLIGDLPERSQRPFYQTNPMAFSGRWVEKSGDFSCESVSQTNPLVRSDVLSSEIVAESPGRRFPERSQRPFSQTNPMAISGRWVEKSGGFSRESASQTNPLARSDVLSSEIVVIPPCLARAGGAA
jgi:hypothetical protein